MTLPRHSPSAPPPHGFVLLEVLLSLTILGVGVVALMSSFNQSFNAARVMEIQTQASFLAQQLMDELEVYPPTESEVSAGFGEGYPFFWYHLRKEYEEPQYRELRRSQHDVEQFFAIRRITITIHYDDGRLTFVPMRVETALIGFEKFSPNTKRSYSTR